MNKDKQIQVRVTELEYKKIEKAAKADDRKISDFVRVTVLKAIK